MRNSPNDLNWLFLKNSRGTANAMRGNRITFMLTLNPNIAIIHDVKVEPRFAPKITAIDCSRLIRPAFTNETTITVDADEL